MNIRTTYTKIKTAIFDRLGLFQTTVHRLDGRVAFSYHIPTSKRNPYNSQQRRAQAVLRAHKEGKSLAFLALGSADFTGMNLDRANLYGSSFVGARFEEASLVGADLSRTHLAHAVFKGADLRNADLRNAVLEDTVFSGALVKGVRVERWSNSRRFPRITSIHTKVAEAVESLGNLDMSEWHSECGTTHCRAGWVVTLAGQEGKGLEAAVGTAAAAFLIYMASDPDMEVFPDFYQYNDKKALESIREYAAREQELNAQEAHA